MDWKKSLSIFSMIFFTVMIELLLDWNEGLTIQVDKDGNTPLHFASSKFFSNPSYLPLEPFLRASFLWCPFVRFHPAEALHQVFKANPAALYQADKNGFIPIHVAASAGASNAIRFFLHERPDSAGLRDARGKTFLHVAIEKQRLDIVSYACWNPSLAWILNMQDNDGNTALHLAIQSGRFRVFCALFGNLKVNLHLTNNLGETPCDVSRSKIPHGLDDTEVKP
jgi:ankyrin repeat protein